MRVAIIALVFLTGCGRNTDYTFYPVPGKDTTTVIVDKEAVRVAYYHGCVDATHSKHHKKDCEQLSYQYINSGGN